MERWTTDQIGDLTGKKVVITGANHGIGFTAASVLAQKGAEVTMAVRSIKRGEEAAGKIRGNHPDALLSVSELDLADLRSVSLFAERYNSLHGWLDLLINNAGVMTPPYGLTKDGFELQFGINHLGHFALTAHLLPLLRAGSDSRIVSVSSIAARKARIRFNNLDGSKGYHPLRFYRQSKLANLLFALELQKRLQRSGASTISLACHPGLSATNILSRNSGRDTGKVMMALMRLATQSAEMGALPTLYAALHPGLSGGEFIGPDGPGNRQGYPVLTSDGEKLYQPQLAERLWEVSESLTGVQYNV